MKHVLSLVIVENESLTSLRYFQEILDIYVTHFAPFIRDNFTFMHYKLRPHTARCLLQYLKVRNIQEKNWSVRSLHLNPIEYAHSNFREEIHQKIFQNLPEIMNWLEAVLRGREVNTFYQKTFPIMFHYYYFEFS